MNIEEAQLKNIIISAIEIGILKGSMQKVSANPFVSKNEAFRTYGRTTVQGWIEQGLIKELKDGEGTSKIRIDRIQLAKIACASNRGYFKATTN